MLRISAAAPRSASGAFASPSCQTRSGNGDSSAAEAVRQRNLVGFAILGVLNNIVFAVSNASASTVLPGAVGLVYIINTAPGLLIKLLAPLWITVGSYNVKVALIGLSLAFNLCVLLVPGVPTWLALLAASTVPLLSSLFAPEHEAAQAGHCRLRLPLCVSLSAAGRSHGLRLALAWS